MKKEAWGWQTKSKSTSNKQIEQLAARTHYDQLHSYNIEYSTIDFKEEEEEEKANNFLFLFCVLARSLSSFLAIVEKETFLRVFYQL